MARLSADGTKILENYDRFTGIPFNATKVTTWRDGSPMDDSKVDNAVYFKNKPTLGGGYSKRDFEGLPNVEWYGALKTGDDTAAITEALNRNDEIFMPKGNYTFTSDVLIDEPKKIQGEDGTEISFVNSCFVVKESINVSHLKLIDGTSGFDLTQVEIGQIIPSLNISNVSFDGVTYPIRMRDAGVGAGISSVFIDRVKITNCSRGIEIKGLFDEVIITSTVIDGAIFGGIVVGDNIKDNQDFYKKTIVSNCIVRNVNGGASSCNAIIVYGIDTIISDNIVEDVVNSTGLDCEGIYTKVKHGIIANNICRDAGLAEASINIKGNYRDEVASGANGFSMIVSGNQVSFTGTSPFVRQGINLAAEDVLVVNNIVEGSTGPAFHTRGAMVGRNFFMINNLARNCDVSGSSVPWIFGVRMCGTNIRIEGNTIDGCIGTYGFYVENRYLVAISKLSNVIVSKNIVTDFASTALYVEPYKIASQPTYNTFGALMITDNIFQDVQNGIVFSGEFEDTTIDSLTVTGNIFRDIGSSSITNAAIVTTVSEESIIGMNIGYDSPTFDTTPQTLSLTDLSGEIVISGVGGNSVRLKSLANLLTLLDANVLPATSGVFSHSDSGSSNYPAASGGGIKYIRSVGSNTAGYFEFWKSSAATDEIWIRTGQGSGLFNSWARIQTIESAASALALKANLASPVGTGVASWPQFKLTALNTAPASATAAGNLGEIRWTATHVYLCIDTNTWVRAALATW